jgi:cold shock CspA family protein
VAAAAAATAGKRAILIAGAYKGVEAPALTPFASSVRVAVIRTENKTMANGLIKRLNTEAGIGFIEGPAGAEEILFHSISMAGGLFSQLKVGQSVEFELDVNERNPKRNRATQVRPAGMGG